MPLIQGSSDARRIGLEYPRFDPRTHLASRHGHQFEPSALACLPPLTREPPEWLDRDLLQKYH